MATRAEIEARMADILNRTDFTDRITIWFDRAYDSLQRRHDFKCMEVTEYLLGFAGMMEFPIPQDIKKSVLLYLYDPVGGGIIRRFRETGLEEVREVWGTTSCGCDPVFTNWYNMLVFAPALQPQDLQLSLRYDYYRYLAPTDNDWFMTRAEDYLVYRGLAESAPFLGADPRLQVWTAFAKEAYDELWRAEVDQKHAGPMWIRG